VAGTAAGAVALGIDVGNAKLKLCTMPVAGGRAEWSSHLLPYDGRRAYARHADFAAGIPPVMEEAIAGRPVAAAVAVMTSGYAYPTYGEGAVHAMQVLAGALPGVPLHALAGDGALVPADAVAGAPGVPFSNGMGAAWLAARLPALGEPACGLAVDTGGDTTQIVALVDGAFDPAAAADARGPLDHRLRHGKFTWIGVQTTPLEALAAEVDVGGRRYPVIPRGVAFDNVAALLELLPPEEARKLSLFGHHPDRARALRALADAVNLDATLASEDELLALARRFHALAVDRLAQAFARALATVPERCRRVLLFGLGARLAAAGARAAGLPAEAIADAADHLPRGLAITASVYGACHAALEKVRGERLPASIGT
jgi:uncharacterized hydantoinase/oxoprolinase family protein